MNEITIRVPVDCEYLSMWKDFDTFLPPGHIILNKEITKEEEIEEEAETVEIEIKDEEKE